mgnify:FL=1
MVTGCKPRFFSRRLRRPQDLARKLQYDSSRPKNHVDQTVFSADLQGNTAPDTERLFQREPYIQYLVLDPASVYATQKLFASKPRFFQGQKP